MGGGESLGIGLNHLELFSYVGGSAPGFDTADVQQTYGAFTPTRRPPIRSCICCGLAVAPMTVSSPPTRAFRKLLEDAKIKHVFKKSDGAHTWINWRRYLNEFAPLLF